MKLSNIVKEAYNRNWSLANTFTVQFVQDGRMWMTAPKIENENINLNLISITTPDFTNDPIESWVANHWRIHNGADQLYRFSMTFKDQDQMLLYRTFYRCYRYTRENYFDDAKMTIHLIKDGDWHHESDIGMLSFPETIIEGLSNLDFSNENDDEIAQFTVNFKSSFSNTYINGNVI